MVITVVAISGIAVWHFVGKLLTSPTPTAQSKPKDMNTAAYVQAQALLSKYLKAPSTAKYPTDFTIASAKDNPNDFRVKGYVDSQNGFGAQIRSDWQADLKFTGGDESDAHNWQPKQLILDGQIIYSTK